VFYKKNDDQFFFSTEHPNLQGQVSNARV